MREAFRFFVCILLGMIIGTALGVAIPIVLEMLSAGPGPGTHGFGILLIFTVPGGAAVGMLLGIATAVEIGRRQDAQKLNALHKNSPRNTT